MSGLFDMINAQSKVFNRHVNVMLRAVVSDDLAGIQSQGSFPASVTL